MDKIFECDPNEIVIVLMWGLPASGKTTYALKLQDSGRIGRFRDSVAYINGDGLFKRNSLKMSFKQAIVEKFRQHYGYNTKRYVIDALITQNSEAAGLLQELNDAFVYHIKGHVSVKTKIVYFREDREACLHNDKFRREGEDCTISIKNLPLEKPNEELIKKWGLEVVEVDVVRKSEFETWLDEFQLERSGVLCSETWCLGGNYGTCWDDVKHEVGADSPPASFEYFDKLIGKIDPNIGFLKYKKLYSACVTVEETGESDYYGGSVTNAHYECNLKKLFEMLKGEHSA